MPRKPLKNLRLLLKKLESHLVMLASLLLMVNLLLMANPRLMVKNLLM